MPRHSPTFAANPTFKCIDCGTETIRRGPRHKRCDACRDENNRRLNREWHSEAENKARRRELHEANRKRINAQQRARRAANREADRAYQRAWRSANRERLSLQRRARVYGLTIDTLADLIERQGGNCPICLLPLGKRFHVDHCHATGAVRGILHDACNKGIGMLGDDPDRCARAATYLRSCSASAA